MIAILMPRIYDIDFFQKIAYIESAGISNHITSLFHPHLMYWLGSVTTLL